MSLFDLATSKLIEEAVARAISDMDSDDFEKTVRKQVSKYFESEYFERDLAEALGEEGVEYAIARKVVGSIAKSDSTFTLTLEQEE